MKPSRTRKQTKVRNSLFAIVAGVFLLSILGAILWFWSSRNRFVDPLRYVGTLAGKSGEIGEPFGLAAKGSDIFISDGQNGKIWRLTDGKLTVFASGLETPSAITFDKNGNLIVADSGGHSIRSINAKSEVVNIAGVNGKVGFADGDAASALFNAPIGLAATRDGKIFVADTYNDRIRLIENGKVSTIAGGERGFADGPGTSAKFDTPCGLVVWMDKLLVADTGNRRIRVVEPDGRVWTLAGNGEYDLKDGLLSESSFVQPTSIAFDGIGSIYVTDGNAIRQLSGTIPVVRTISAEWRGLRDGAMHNARFNQPSGLAVDGNGNLIVADSENRLVRSFSPVATSREITPAEIASMRDKPETFRTAQPARWPYDPPSAKRDIAGTLGEIRGQVPDNGDGLHYHNGLDIAGAYGETARFIRDEKVLRPIAAENFGTLRELLRLPTLGYIHIRLGRNASSVPFGDPRFEFEKDNTEKLTGIRVPRGAKFKAGEPIGTLNPMNHVHLIAGRSGSEMNAMDALTLPGIVDTKPPTIEKVTIYDQNWIPVETVSQNSRIKLTGKTRVVVRAFDQMDGNPDRRRLGVYKVGYQVLREDKSPVGDVKWTIVFDRMPANDSITHVYANESHSGATGETIFNYIATNLVDGDDYREDFLDPSSLGPGNFVLKVFAADYFANVASKEIFIEVLK